jgi:hypothetical protein
VDLPIEFNVGVAEKQFEIWETRIRLHDRREKEAERVAASSPAPDGDVEMGVHLPPILAKKRSIVEVCIVVVCYFCVLTLILADRICSLSPVRKRSSILRPAVIARRRGVNRRARGRWG